MGGAWAPRPNTGPHKLRECLPVILILRNRLKYALNANEVQTICMNKHVEIDGKVRTDPRFPAGFQDVVSLPKANDNFRLLFDTKGRFVLHKISKKETGYKLCKVMSSRVGARKVPCLTTHDGRTLRYPDPLIKVNDTVKVDLKTGKVTEFVKFDVGALIMVTKGRNTGRVGVIVHREKHQGSFEIIQVRDATGQTFATRLSSVFVIGENEASPLISIPKSGGIKKTIIQEMELRAKRRNQE